MSYVKVRNRKLCHTEMYKRQDQRFTEHLYVTHFSRNIKVHVTHCSNTLDVHVSLYFCRYHTDTRKTLFSTLEVHVTVFFPFL